MEANNNQEDEEIASVGVGYPHAPPQGSVLPPHDFQRKMKDVERMYPSDGGCRHGMFTQPVFAWRNFPNSLHFAHANNPSVAAQTVVKAIHDNLLGYQYGKKEGTYGAGGGAVHVMYLGRPCSDDGDSSFPRIHELLDLLHLSPPYQPSNMQWMTTVDPLHQQLFPKRRNDSEYDENDSVLSLDAFCDLLTNRSTTIDTRTIVTDIPPHVTLNYPCLAAGRIMFLLPRFAALHDGDCLAEPVLCPTALAFQNRSNHNEYWSQFQARPEVNVGVFLEESTTTDGPAKEAGDIYESPVFALFQLNVTGEILGLVQWDYRD